MCSHATCGRASLCLLAQAAGRCKEDSYFNANADAVTTKELTNDAIVADVTGKNYASDNEDAMVSCAHKFNVQTLSPTLNGVDFLRHFFGTHGDCKNGINVVATAEKDVFRLRCQKQKIITDFFPAMSSVQ